MNQTVHNQSGVFVPMQVLGHPALNPAMVCTWMQLRLLVGDQAESVTVSIAELEAYTGKSRSALYTHMTALRRAELVDWRFAARRMLVFSLPGGLDSEKLDQEPELQSGNQDQSNKVDQLSGLESKKLDRGTEIESEKPDYSEKLDQLSGLQSENLDQGTGIESEKPDYSEKLVQQSGLQSKKLDQLSGLESGKLDGNPSYRPENWIENGVQPEISSQTRLESRNLDGKPSPSPENWNPALSLKPLINNNNLNINQEEVLREAQFQKTGPDSGNLEKEAVRAYRATLGLRPNQAQRAAIGEEVKDLELWQSTLEHWQMHGWNPKNILGILEIYARDGPEGCRFCRKDKPATGLAALALMREAIARGEYG